MALDSTQKASRLFKKAMGKAETIIGRDFFEEPKKGLDAVFPTQIWTQADRIPETAPVLTNGAKQGVVQYFEKVSLTHVDGSTNMSYYSDTLIDAIPFTYGTGGSYNYTLYTNAGTVIPFGQGDWLVDTAAGVVTFYTALASVTAAAPPMISFYKYIGTKGLSSTGTGLNILDPVKAASTSTEEFAYSAATDSYSLISSIDGITTFADGDRFLIKDQDDPIQNGVFVYQSGSFVRASTSVSVNDYVFVLSGDSNAYTGWVITGTDSDSNAITNGTNTQEWTFFSASNSYTTDDLGLKLTGNKFEISLDETTDTVNGSGLVQTTAGLKINQTVFDDISALEQTTQSIEDYLNNLTGFGIVPITYNALVLAKNGGTLVSGQEYLITDYHTVHTIPYTNVINTGAVEPIIVTANSTSSLLKIAKSMLYPNDIIHYDIDDNSCEDGIYNAQTQRYANGTARNGKIVYRKDLKYNLSAHCDWRAERFRRWSIDADEFRSNLGGSPASIDTTFITTGANDTITDIKFLSNGKILVLGEFTSFNGTSANGIVLLNPNGTIDTSFDYGAGFLGTPYVAYELVNGQILIGGLFTNYKGTVCSNLIKINTSGDVVTSKFSEGTNGVVYSITQTSFGTILIGGSFTQYTDATVGSIIATDSYGNVVSSPNFGTGFANTSSAIVYSIKVDLYNSILIGGSFNSYDGTTVSNIVKLTSNGLLDSVFPTTGTFNNIVKSILVYNDRYLVGGDFTTYNSSSANHIVRLTMTGTIDSVFSFGSGFNGNVSDMIYDSINDKYIIIGSFTTYNGTSSIGISRVGLDGSIDLTFNTGNGVTGTPLTIDYSSSTGRIMLAGTITTYNSTVVSNVVAINSTQFTSVSYTKGMVVKEGENIYMAASDTVTSTALPSVNNADWIYLTKLSKFKYLLSEPTVYNNFNVKTTEYMDFYLFTILSEMSNSSGVITSDQYLTKGYGYQNIEIGKVNYGAITGRNRFNNVFYIQPDGFSEKSIGDVVIGDNSTDNTINASGFIENYISDYFYGNIIDSNFNYNKIAEKFTFNLVTESFYGNNIGLLCSNNVFAGEFIHNDAKYRFMNNKIQYKSEKNTFGNDFENNTHKHAVALFDDFTFSYNAFGDDITANVFGYNFNSNIVGDTTADNTFGNNASSNIINGNFSDNTIGDSFINNKIVSIISSVAFGNAFMGYTINDPLSSIDLTAYSGLYFNTESNQANVEVSQNTGTGTGVEKLTVKRYSAYNQIEFFNFTKNDWEVLVSGGGFNEGTAGNGLTYVVADEKLNVNVDDYTVKIVNNELRSSIIFIEAPDTTTTIAMGQTGSTHISLTYDPVTPVMVSVNGIEYLVSPATTSSANMPFFYSQYPPVKGTVINYDSSISGFGLDSGVDCIIAKYNYIDLTV